MLHKLTRLIVLNVAAGVAIVALGHAIFYLFG
jgi:hypothetical protein